MKAQWRNTVVWTALILAWATAGWAQRLTLAWDASPSSGVAGYRLCYGTNAGAYQFATNVGPALSHSVVLPHGGRWFFAVTSYSTNGLESDYSNEVSFNSEPGAPVLGDGSWVRVTPFFGRSTNLVSWESFIGAPVVLPATNRAEFFRVQGVVMEKVTVP